MVERLSFNSSEFENSQTIAEILRAIGEEYGFDEETCSEVGHYLLTKLLR